MTPYLYYIYQWGVGVGEKSAPLRLLISVPNGGVNSSGFKARLDWYFGANVDC